MRDSTGNKILNWAIFIAVIANIVVFSSFSAIFLSSVLNNTSESGEILRVPRTSNPVTMDPCDSWDSVSNNMFDQICEPLIATDLSDPNFPLIGRLAESWVFLSTHHGTNITFTLRQNVYFHDGQLFTGEDVIHTFERINFFGNWSGTLDPATHVMSFPHSIYKFSDGIPIFNDTLSSAWWDVHKATDPYTVMLFLNRPFAPAEGLIAYAGSSIVGHESTPAQEMLVLGEDLVIGTGPFRLLRYIPNSETRFVRWERYWRTGAYWDEIIYVYYRDAVSANNAMLAGKIDFLGQGLSSLKPDFEVDPDITVTGDGTNPYINGSIYWYIAFDSEKLDLTWRKAISHAFNYTYLNHDIAEDTTVRANSLVPPGFPAHNSSVTGAHYNISLARQYMQSMGYGVGWDIGTMDGDKFIPGGNEADWQASSFVPAVGNFSNNALTFHHRSASHFITLLIQRFTEDMDLIGIYIDCYDPWDPWPYWPPPTYDYEIFYVGWGPDYFETFNMIDPLVNPESDSNFANIDNPEINALLDLTMAETDTVQRYEYYKKLQYLIIDKYAYHMPLMYDKLYHVHASSLQGFPYNCMRKLYWYPTYRE